MQLDNSPVEDGNSDARKAEHTFPAPAFSGLDMAFIIFGIISYMADQISDIWVAIHYYKRNGKHDMWYFGLTLAFVILPSLITTIFSLKWYIEDVKMQRKKAESTSRTKWTFRGIFHFIQLSQIWRYIETFKVGCQSRRMKDKADDFRLLLSYEDSDAALLRLFEAFIESGPQMVLQIYILSKRDELASGYFDEMGVTAPIQVISLLSSLISMSWALCGYQRCLRFSIESKKNLTWPGSIVQFIWYAGTLWSRVISLALFASVYPLAFVIICALHWLIMTAWIILMKTEFCQSKCEEFLYNIVIGLVYVFCYFNVKDEPTRRKYSIYYTVTFIESSVMIGLWFHYMKETEEWYLIYALSSFFVSFVIGIACMLFFYIRLHPSITTFRKSECYLRSRTPPIQMPTIDGFQELDPIKLNPLQISGVSHSNVSNNRQDITDGSHYRVYTKWGRQ